MAIYDTEDWLLKEPEFDKSMISKSLETDVIVVGAGIAGVAAIRTITELGGTVAVFEKCKGVQARSGDFAIMDSKIAKRWGRDKLNKPQIVGDLMKDMAYKASQDILKRWSEEAGEAFDWYLKGYPEIEVLDRTDQVPKPDSRCWIQPRRLPLPEGYKGELERYPCHQVTAWIRPTHIRVCKGNYNIATASGLVKEFFKTRVIKLLREPEGRVYAVIAKDENGAYIKATARKGVILATGDYMSDKQMLHRFLPGMADAPKQWTSLDIHKEPSNTGDGHKMGMWIGAKMQDAPHAPCAHHMGSVFGVSDFLLLNTRGKRFVNEDASGQQLGSQIENLPDKSAWQFVDSNWREQIPKEYPNHGSVCFIVEDEALESGKIYNKLCFIDNYIAPKYIEKALLDGTLLKADTLEELVEKTKLPKEETLKSIKRYNELCDQGQDLDYGKRHDRLFSVQKGPYYASKFTPAIMIAAMGGLQSDEEARCYDTKGQVIPGLYLAGNVQGNRIAVDYPLTVPGLSHSLALTYGRIAGRKVMLNK